MKPLSGIRVVDFTQAVFGAGATQLLGDLGADVIKIEPPWGDFMRLPRFSRPHRKASSTDGSATPPTAPWLAMNRNKRSVALDLRDQRCLEVCQKLVATADVVASNFRAGTMDSLGLGFDAVASGNPRVVYLEMTAFGDTGPMKRWAGGDMWAQALGGAVSVQGTPATGPCLVSIPIADQAGAILGALGVVAALMGRERAGDLARPSHVTTSLIDAVLSMQSAQIADFTVDGRLLGKGGRGWRGAFPFGAYTASDGDVVIFHGEQEEDWRTVCELLELHELLGDPRCATRESREQHREELYPILDAAFAQNSRAVWQETFFNAGLRCDPCLDYGEMTRHPQITENDHLWEFSDSDRGRVATVAPPLKFDGSRGTEGALPPPDLGEHTREVLSELGLKDSEIMQLRDAGLIVLPGEEPG